MKNSVKALGASGLLVGGLALGSVLSPIGLASAQDDDPGVEAPATDPAGDLAEHGHFGRGGPGHFGATMLERLVEDGVIDQATADDISAWVDAARTERQAEREAQRAERLEMVAGYIGISADDLQAALQDGQSLAEIATANGKDVDQLIDELVTEAQAEIQERAAANDIPQERVDEMLANVEARVTARVNGERPEGPRGGPGHHGPHGDRPGGPAGPEDTDA
jgi:hypothetical protein